MIGANYVDPMLPRMSPDQLRMLIAQAAGLLAHHQGSPKAALTLRRVMNALPPLDANSELEEIVMGVSARRDVSVQGIMGPTRLRKFAWPRQEAMYLARRSGRYSFLEIARYFKRDHSTIIHGVRRHEARLKARERA